MSLLFLTYSNDMMHMQQSRHHKFYQGWKSMVTAHDSQISALPMMGRAEVSNSGDFRELLCVFWYVS